MRFLTAPRNVVSEDRFTQRPTANRTWRAALAANSISVEHSARPQGYTKWTIFPPVAPHLHSRRTLLVTLAEILSCSSAHRMWLSILEPRYERIYKCKSRRLSTMLMSNSDPSDS